MRKMIDRLMPYRGYCYVVAAIVLLWVAPPSLHMFGSWISFLLVHAALLILGVLLIVRHLRTLIAKRDQ